MRLSNLPRVTLLVRGRSRMQTDLPKLSYYYYHKYYCSPSLLVSTSPLQCTGDTKPGRLRTSLFHQNADAVSCYSTPPFSTDPEVLPLRRSGGGNKELPSLALPTTACMTQILFPQVLPRDPAWNKMPDTQKGPEYFFPEAKINLLLYTQRPKGLISMHLSTFPSVHSTWKTEESKKYILPFSYFSYQFKKYSKSAENFFEKLLCPSVGIPPQDLLLPYSRLTENYGIVTNAHFTSALLQIMLFLASWILLPAPEIMFNLTNFAFYARWILRLYT